MNNGAESGAAYQTKEAVQRLVADLVEIGAQTQPVLDVDWELLSIMVDEAANGVDIMRRHPAFYHKLLDNVDLRQAFLDALESLEVAANQDRSMSMRTVG